MTETEQKQEKAEQLEGVIVFFFVLMLLGIVLSGIAIATLFAFIIL